MSKVNPSRIKLSSPTSYGIIFLIYGIIVTLFLLNTMIAEKWCNPGSYDDKLFFPLVILNNLFWTFLLKMVDYEKIKAYFKQNRHFF